MKTLELWKSESLTKVILTVANGRLFRKDKLFGIIPFFSKEIDLSNAVDAVILQYTMVDASEEDINSGESEVSIRYKVYELHLLNEKHNNRNKLLSFRDWDNAHLAGKFIGENTKLNYDPF